MAKRTFENCSLIKHSIKVGLGEPERYGDKCLGYENDTGEPCEACKQCKLNTAWEE